MIYIDSIRRLSAMLLFACTVAFAANALAPATASAQGGPVVIIGIDPEQGMPGMHGPVSAYRSILDQMISQTSNSGTGIAVIGSDTPATNVTNLWNAVANQAPAIPITHVSGAAAISALTFNQYKVIVVASDDRNVVNGVTPQEWNALMNRKPALRQFVNCGGGVYVMNAPDNNPNWYNFLSFPTPGSVSYQTVLGGFPANTNNSTLTAAATTYGYAAGLNALRTSTSDLWHNRYTSFPTSLSPLFVLTQGSIPVALGHPAVYANTLPTADAGADQTIECTSHSGVSATLTGSGADADNDALTYTWWYNGNQIGDAASIMVNNLMVGTYTYTLKVEDGQCGSATDQVVVTVQDTQPPTISGVGDDATIECPAMPVFSTPSASDACDPNPSLTYADVTTNACGGTYSVTRTWTATDAEGNTSSDSQTITVEDNYAPEITLNAAVTLWPPNHEYVSFDITDMVASVSDACASTLGVSDVTIHSVWSDEAEDATGGGDGATLDDIVIACDYQSVMLRKERQGAGNGRVYTVKLQVSDGCNTGYEMYKVYVPRNTGNMAMDDGAAYTVSTCTMPKDLARRGAVPAGMTLSQNYPNPFNPSTTISFAIPQAADVTLRVFDVNGREVALVAQGGFAAGTHTLVFDASDLPSGLYSYRLESSGVILSRVMQLVK